MFFNGSTVDSLEKSLMLGKTEGWRRGCQSMRWLDGQRASPTQWTRTWASSGRWWVTGRPRMVQSMGLQRVRHNWGTEQQWWWWCIMRSLKFKNKSQSQDFTGVSAWFKGYFFIINNFHFVLIATLLLSGSYHIWNLNFHISGNFELFSTRGKISIY